MANKVVDLTLLKRLVSELELTLTSAEAMTDVIDYTLEVSRATGLASGIMTEAMLLTGDIQGLLAKSSASPKNDTLDKLMQGLKGPSTKN